MIPDLDPSTWPVSCYGITDGMDRDGFPDDEEIEDFERMIGEGMPI
jgi:hypothetical protein